MSQHPTVMFHTGCEAIAPLELIVSGPGCASGERCVFERPFVLVGQDERSCLRLEDTAVSRRHAYLQQIGGRVFCVDLGSRTGIRWGGELRPAGWLRPEQGIQIGPFTLELPTGAGSGEVPEDRDTNNWNPLQDRDNDLRVLPRITLEVGDKVVSRLHMNRVLVLVGSSPACRIRLHDAGISPYHCSLVRTPQGIWLIDLLSGSGTCVNGQPQRDALVKEGDRLQVGPYVLRIWHPVPPSPGPGVESKESSQEQSASPAALPSPMLAPQPAELDRARERQQEVETLRQQLADRQDECERLREQTRTLEFQIAEAAGLQARLEAAEASVREFDVVRGEGIRWQTEAQDLQAQLAAVETEREEARQRLEAAEQQLVGANEAVCTAEARLAQDSETLLKVRTDLADLNAEHEAALRALQEVQEKLALSQDEAGSLQAELTQARDHQQDIETLRQQLADVQAEHAELCARVPELENRANSADHLSTQLQDAGAETERLRGQMRAAESRETELEAVRAECEQLREKARALDSQVAEISDLQTRLEAAEATVRELDVVRGEGIRWQTEAEDLQARLTAAETEREEWRQRLEAAETEREEWRQRLEAAEAGVRELDVIRGEREHWQAEAQNLQSRLAAGVTDQEQLGRLAADLHAAQRERDQLRTEQEIVQHSTEKTSGRVSELERALGEAAAAHETALEEARTHWESERQALQTRLELEGQTHHGAIQAAVREVQVHATAERENWRHQLQGAESQLVWEREMFQEQLNQLRQQVAGLQAERDRLAAQLKQAEPRRGAAEERSPDAAPPTTEVLLLRQQDAREQVFIELSAMRSGQLLRQTARPQRPDALAEQARLPAPLQRERPPGEDQRLSVIVQNVQAGWGEAAGGETAVKPPSPPSAGTGDKEEVPAPPDTAQDTAAPLGEGEKETAEDAPSVLPQQKDTQPEAQHRRWRQLLGFVLGK